MIRIRSAVPQDAERLLEIYEYYVRNTAISFEIMVPTAEEFRGRIERILKSYPYLVAEEISSEDAGEGEGRIAGYVYADRYKGREAYDHCCETSIYLDRGAVKQGIGGFLYAELEAELADMGIRNLYACVTCPSGEPDGYSDWNSADFHAHMGYETVGRFHRCGIKFGRFYDTLWMEKFIGEAWEEQPDAGRDAPAGERPDAPDIKRIAVPGITYITELPGKAGWFWGTDHASGDLYEAEELYRGGYPVRKNRLVFISYPEGEVFEPVAAEEGQYFGRPEVSGGKVYLLIADFPAEEIRILECACDMKSAEVFAKVPLSEVPDCYNLMLTSEPLALVRQGHENRFMVVWPEKGEFPIAPQESLDSRDGDRLYFSKWYEDPDYREETVVRRYPDGEIEEELNGTLMTMPDGRKWLLEQKYRRDDMKEKTSKTVIRRAEEKDYPFILRVNEENVEVLSPMDEEKLRRFSESADMLCVAEYGGEPAAFLIGLREGVEWYTSENYLWFSKEYPSFLYIDRIVIDEPFRRMGVGRALYEAVFARAAECGVPTVTCEIDTIPYNEASLNFHKEMGFSEVGEQFVRGGTVKVSLQAADVSKEVKG